MVLTDILALVLSYFIISFFCTLLHHLIDAFDSYEGSTTKWFYEKDEIKLLDLPLWFLEGGGILIGWIFISILAALIPVINKVYKAMLNANITVYTRKRKQK